MKKLFALPAIVALMACAVVSGACGSTIIVSSGDCVVGDRSFDIGDSFLDEDGCNTCTCDAVDIVSCTQKACEDCQGPQPECETGPPCTGGPVCRGGVWECDVECTECGNQPPIDCIAPPGCFYEGPYCEIGEWTCGELFCDPEPCQDDPPLCEQPADPNCFAEAYCDEFGWECLVSCTSSCEDQFFEGYQTATELIVKNCGCIDDSPCQMACQNDKICISGGLNLSPPCEQCMVELSEMQADCIFDAALGRECQSDPDCEAYIQCVLGG